MLLADIYANGFLFDIELDEDNMIVRGALEIMDEPTLRQTIADSFTTLGLTYDNLDEMNQNATWAFARKAASLV